MRALHHTLPATLLCSLLLAGPATAAEPAAPAVAAAANSNSTDAVVAAAAAADTGSTDASVSTAIAAPATAIDWRRQISIRARAGTGMRGEPDDDGSLRLVVRSDTAKVTALKVGEFALRALGGAGTTHTFSKDDLKGERIPGVPSPAHDILPGLLRDRLDGYFAAHPGAIPGESHVLEASTAQWALVYQKLSPGATAYELRHDLTIGFPIAGVLRGPAGRSVKCAAPPQVATLEEWQADDYAKVKAASTQLAEQCAELFATQLPNLLQDVANEEAVALKLAAANRTPKEGDGAVAKSRIRIFGANGQGITMLTDAPCREQYSGKVQVVRSAGRAIGSVFGGAPDNVSLGMPETDTVRNMKSFAFSKPNYQEVEVAGGRPLIFDARIENTNDYRCASDLSLQFIPEPGADYEVFMKIGGGMCLLFSTQVVSDGSLRHNPTLQPRNSCRAPSQASLRARVEMTVFLFEPGNVHYRSLGQGDDDTLHVLADSADNAARFDEVLQQTATLPGTRVCVVVPDLDYTSALHGPLEAMVLDKGPALPGLWETAATVNQRRGVAAGTTIDLAAATWHCQGLPRAAFDPR
ncbi:hypothetical protein [Stenotrophomonas rhizophila]|uniref:hypothetical protein n=1 Tax=Stenotrophomonas rhizophila TaxID=216778 RepID=UPI001E33E520|nr:hypothetical protein [Stenotrophomonas rhizophila]MCC7633390.1 hypothetical protein [Stenotrophomonas rhizophila]MCC7663124.1 hypothetical protein [Stenotrophomonas rhizophila]